jgi:signal transduction histidine kinase
VLFKELAKVGINWITCKPVRLFTKYSRVSILASILAVLLGGVGYFFAVQYVLVHELDDALKIEEEEIMDHVRREQRLPEPANYRDQQIAFVPATEMVRRRFLRMDWQEIERRTVGAITVPGEGKASAVNGPLPFTAAPGADSPSVSEKSRLTARKSHSLDPDQPCRVLVFPIRTGSQAYTVFVCKSEEEAEDLLVMIMIITAGMILLMLGVLFLANRLLLRRIWQPFYKTLESIRSFNLSSRKPLPAAPTDIEEFRRLDEAARQMTGQILRDYEMLRNFTDNASHEMQTPLAIINSKLDLLIQDPALKEAHHQPVQAMYDAIGRLRQLNQGLLLLTKIENNQFPETESVDLAPLITAKLTQLEDPLKDRHLRVRSELSARQVAINGYLADILLNNLLLNAIRHNHPEGEVDIRLTERSLCISNSGLAPSFDTATVFDRFVKGAHSNGTGLGLAIVRQICDNYRFSLRYSYQAGLHSVEVGFPEP